MLTLTRYLIAETFKAHVLCVTILVLIFSIFTFVDQLQETGQNAYRMIDAAWYVILITPNQLIEIAPFAALFGTLLSVGNLVRHSEIVSMFAIGRSFHYIIASLTAASIPLIAAIIISILWLAPALYQHAELQKSIRTSGIGMLVRDQGFWARDNQSILSVRGFEAGNLPRNITVYELNSQGGLNKHIKADSAVLQPDGSWQLENVTERRPSQSNAIRSYVETQNWQPIVQDVKAELYKLPLASLSLQQLLAKQKLAIKQDTPNRQLGLLFWQRLLLPYTVLGMVFFAAAFMLTSLQRGQLSKQVVICSGVGVLCTLAAQVATSFSTLAVYPIAMGMLPGSILMALTATRYYSHYHSTV